jgi:hypothetical protein
MAAQQKAEQMELPLKNSVDIVDDSMTDIS